MDEDEIVNEIYDRIETTFALECDLCCEIIHKEEGDQEAAADFFFTEGFTFIKFKPDSVGGEIVCAKCR